jgi:hypothetical protein
VNHWQNAKRVSASPSFFLTIAIHRTDCNHSPTSQKSRFSPSTIQLLKVCPALSRQDFLFFDDARAHDAVHAVSEGLDADRKPPLSLPTISGGRKDMTLSRLARLTAMLLISVLWLNTLVAAAAKPVDPAAMKAKVQSRGVGRGVRVTLADKSEAKGVIVSIGDQAFTVKPKGAAQPQEIQYAQVTGVHGDKMGTGTKVIIVVVIAGATIGIIAAVWVHKFNNGFKNITFPPISSLDLRRSALAFAANSLETA